MSPQHISASNKKEATNRAGPVHPNCIGQCTHPDDARGPLKRTRTVLYAFARGVKKTELSVGCMTGTAEEERGCCIVGYEGACAVYEDRRG